MLLGLLLYGYATGIFSSRKIERATYEAVPFRFIDYPDCQDQAMTHQYTPHIRSRGQERQEKLLIPAHRARRWVVERTHSWLNRLRS
jgi:hypothetical protein